MMQTTEEYFSTVNQGVKHQRFSVKDKNGLEVERIFKATKGKQSLYTINMYHTTCSCLVNGKQSKYFIDNDLKEIMILIQQKIYGTSLEEVNDSIRDIVLKYYTTEDEEIVDIVQEKTDYSDLKMCTLSDEIQVQFKGK